MRHASDLASVVLAVLPQMAVFTNDSLKEMYVFLYYYYYYIIKVDCNYNFM